MKNDWIFAPRLGPKRMRARGMFPGISFNTPGGDGGGGGGGEVSNEPESGDDDGGVDNASAIAQAVAEATKGLKRNRDEILDEKKKLQDQVGSLTEQFEALGGTDGVQQLIEMRQRLEKDELGKLLADGRHDEWFEQRTQAMRANHENQLAALQEKLDAAETKAAEAEKRFTESLLKTQIMSAATEVGVVDSAVEDVARAARETFDFDVESGEFVIHDENGGIVLGPDGKSPKTMSEWLEERKQTSRHWFPPSQGAGANGSLGSSREGEPDLSRMSMQQYQEWRKEKGMGTGHDHPLSRR